MSVLELQYIIAVSPNDLCQNVIDVNIDKHVKHLNIHVCIMNVLLQHFGGYLYIKYI